MDFSLAQVMENKDHCGHLCYFYFVDEILGEPKQKETKQKPPHPPIPVKNSHGFTMQVKIDKVEKRNIFSSWICMSSTVTDLYISVFF